MQRGTDRRKPSGLLLAYVDESYSSDWFSLGAVVGDGTAVKRIEVGLDALLAGYDGRFGLGLGTELHGYPMFQARGSGAACPYGCESTSTPGRCG